ncbi:hypothetical protein N7U66_05060 [Lacinutrix neustonica]|uniref:Uncharacterized protein n=1 Tax=Lacinutrix neustonica TaxID=2980107 RepID=A0A9E8MXU0_9FLAO|nr:hypothetical protein [Lacinutrix neustonica]WAC03001.1 hypothetical protein N7U66_05060 [Lacinutrix neustonica]
MKIPLKKISIAIIGILFVGFILYKITISSLDKERNYEKYGMAFNAKRAEIGLMEISENWESEYLGNLAYSDDNITGFEPSEFEQVFSFSDITSGMNYVNHAPDNNTTFIGKVIWINSNILFWKNGISGEMDMYERDIDSSTTESLNITYHFRDDNGNKDYFEANHSIYKLDEFSCGTPLIMEREEQRIYGKPYFGNITKKQADSILTKWNKKN